MYWLNVSKTRNCVSKNKFTMIFGIKVTTESEEHDVNQVNYDIKNLKRSRN